MNIKVGALSLVGSMLIVALSSSHTLAASCTWLGGSSSNWSTSANWGAGCSGAGGIPANTDDITIPNNTSTNNDLVGLELNSITFSGSPGGTLSGNDLIINDAVSGLFPHQISLHLILGGNVSISTNAYNNGIDLNGNNLIAAPSVLPWGITSEISGAGTFNAVDAGPIYLSGGATAAVRNFTIEGDTQLFIDGVWGNGTTININDGAGYFGPGGNVDVYTDGTAAIAPSRGGISGRYLTTANILSLNPGDEVSLYFDGTVRGGDYDSIEALSASNAIDLTGVDLNLDFATTPDIGDEFILIDTAGTITGFFNDLPNGETFTMNDREFMIIYSENSVVLAAIATLMNPSFTANPTSPTVGQPVTITSVWSGTGGTPTGTAELYEGDTLLGTTELVNGIATFNLSNLAVGSHTLNVIYSGDDMYEGAISSPLVLNVLAAEQELATTGLNPYVFYLSVAVLGMLSAVQIYRLRYKS